MSFQVAIPIIIFIVVLILVAFLAYLAIPGLREKSFGISGTTVIAIANIILAIIAVISLYYTQKSLSYTKEISERAEQLFIGQNKPLLDVTPIRIIQRSRKQAMVEFSIANYSGFTAYNIRFDLKYGNYDWILEWRKAENDRTSKNEAGIEIDKPYETYPEKMISELKSGETIGLEMDKKIYTISGQLNLEEEVCSVKEGIPVLVRFTWENEKHHVFDMIQKYKLICTAVREGRSLTFIHEGTISQKDTII